MYSDGLNTMTDCVLEDNCYNCKKNLYYLDIYKFCIKCKKVFCSNCLAMNGLRIIVCHSCLSEEQVSKCSKCLKYKLNFTLKEFGNIKFCYDCDSKSDYDCQFCLDDNSDINACADDIYINNIYDLIDCGSFQINKDISGTYCNGCFDYYCRNCKDSKSKIIDNYCTKCINEKIPEKHKQEQDIIDKQYFLYND